MWRSLLILSDDQEIAERIEVELFASISASEQSPDGGGHDVDMWRDAIDRTRVELTARRETLQVEIDQSEPIEFVDPRAPVVADLTAPLEELTDQQRAMVVLRRIAGLDLDAVAVATSTSRSEVDRGLDRASSRLTEPIIARIHLLEPPDLWPRIVEQIAPTAEPARVRGGGLTLAASLFLVAMVGTGLYWLVSPTAASPDASSPAITPVDPEPGGDSFDPERLVTPVTNRPDGRAKPLVMTATDDDSAIYDLRLSTGDRFRLSVPRALGPELDTVVSDPSADEIHVIGPRRTRLRIGFTPCTGLDRLTLNRQGSLVGRIDDRNGTAGSIRLCRPGEQLVTTVVTDVDLDDAQFNAFDVRPVELGPASARRRRSTTGDVDGEPVRVGPVIVTTVGPDRIAAVDVETLSQRWVYSLPVGNGGTMAILSPPTGGVHGGHSPGLKHGVWVAGSRIGIVNLDPETGRLQWTLKVPGGRVQSVAATDDQVFVAYTAATIGGAAGGTNSVVGAFDIETGEPDFAIDVGPTSEGPSAKTQLQVLRMDEQPALVAMTGDGSLTLIDLPGGKPRWSQPVVESVEATSSVRTDDGRWVLRVQGSAAGADYLDVDTGERLLDVRLPVPPSDCEVRHGSLAQVFLWQPRHPSIGADLTEASRPPNCVVVAESQELRVWSADFGPVTLTWAGGREQVTADDFVDLGPVDRVLSIGPNPIEVSPSEDLTVWVMATEASPTAAFDRADDAFGPIEIGMTAAEAAAALDGDLEFVEFDTSSGCLAVHGDPYSPIFRTRASAAGLFITDISADC